MISWPGVLKFDGDDELVYIASETQWLNDAESHLYNYRGDDRLIDSAGHVYRLVDTNDGIRPESTGQQVALDEFIRLVRIHASNAHRCCIEKISFRTIAEGIDLVNSMHRT